MSYDQGLVDLYTSQYSTNLELTLQQKGSLLRGLVNEGMHKGKMASPINQINPITLQKPQGRFTPLNPIATSYARRWVFPQPGDATQMVDSFDELETLVDPKSALVENASNAVGRGWDDEILVATTATAYTGVDIGALGTEAFDTSKYQISDSFDASSSVGLTVAKLLELKRLFTHYHNDLTLDPVTLIIGSQQENDLLSQQEIVSREYSDRPVLVDGNLKRFLGFNIVVSERVPQTTAGSVRGCVAFVKSGMYLGMWEDMTNKISQRDDLTGQPWQIYTKVMYGATRTQLGKVFQILCADTTGGDITP